ncbi:helix-turn-helix domain-containing protein [Bacillus spizizenii]|nr:helix-turn-helix domain-containing protein [Bacillus spizizenii]MCY9124999.1 helix-turn-helix domain-containing protein [Bacillus spizizenii]
MKHVGDLLRLKRLEKRYTLETTAKSVGVSINYISKLEKGDNYNPSDEVIVNLSKTLDLDEDWLFNAFGKIPLSTRKTLMANPTLSKAIASISSNNDLTESQKEEFLKRTIYWFKKISDDNNNK